MSSTSTTASATYSAVVQGKTGNEIHPVSTGSNKTIAISTGSNKTIAISTGFNKNGAVSTGPNSGPCSNKTGAR